MDKEIKMGSSKPTRPFKSGYDPFVEDEEELVAPFDDIREEDFFEKDLDALEAEELANMPEREYIPMQTEFEPIPEEAQKEILSNFALKKREKEEVTAKHAQRLVNQFRALSAFPEDYVIQYNKDLMAAPPEVLAFMPTIIGGPAVREYLDYLLAQKKQGKEYDDENIDFSITTDEGYLPSPDDEEGFYEGRSDMVYYEPEQSRILQEIYRANQKQSETLTEAFELFREAIKRGEADTPELSGDERKELYEMRQTMMENSMQKMVEMHTQMVDKTLQGIYETVQAMKEQMGPRPVVRQALSSLKATQTPVKEDVEPASQQPAPAPTPVATQAPTPAPTPAPIEKASTPTPVEELEKKPVKKTVRKAQKSDIDEDEEFEILSEFDLQ